MWIHYYSSLHDVNSFLIGFNFSIGLHAVGKSFLEAFFDCVTVSKGSDANADLKNQDNSQKGRVLWRKYQK